MKGGHKHILSIRYSRLREVMSQGRDGKYYWKGFQISKENRINFVIKGQNVEPAFNSGKWDWCNKESRLRFIINIFNAESTLGSGSLRFWKHQKLTRFPCRQSHCRIGVFLGILCRQFPPLLYYFYYCN